MKALIAAWCCLMLAASPLALAQDKGKGDEKKAAKAAETAKKEPTEAQKKQQERMKACNARAADKKLEGDARKKFMSACLGGEDAGLTDKQKAQQQRMRECNRQAGEKELAGDARKKFMSACLKG